MKKSRFTEDQIVGVLKAQEAGLAVAELCRKHGVSAATFYKWKAKYGGLEVSEARKLKALEEENAKLKRMVAEAMLDNVALKCSGANSVTSQRSWLQGLRHCRFIGLPSLLPRREAHVDPEDAAD